MHLSTYTPFSLPLLTLFPAWGFLPTISKKSNEGWWRLSLGSTQLYISPHCKPLSLSSWTGGAMAASYQQYGRWKNNDQWFSSVKTSISQMICLFLRIAHPLAYPHGSSSARVRFKFRFSAMQREEWFQVHDARIGTRGGGEHRDTQNTDCTVDILNTVHQRILFSDRNIQTMLSSTQSLLIVYGHTVQCKPKTVQNNLNTKVTFFCLKTWLWTKHKVEHFKATIDSVVDLLCICLWTLSL